MPPYRRKEIPMVHLKAPSPKISKACRGPNLTLQHPAITRDIERIRSLKRSGLRTNTDTAIEIGASLQRLKSRLQKGLWSRLLRNLLHCGATTAKRYISLYRFATAHGPFVGHFKHLGPSKISSLIALAPVIRRKVLSSSTHRIPGAGTKTLEEMNSREFSSFLRGLDPSRHCRAPRSLHLFRAALRAARQLATQLGALKGRTLNDSELLKKFLEAILAVKRMLACYPGESALRRRYARAVTG